MPGHRWVAFDVTAHVDPTSWWVSLVSGITDLTPRMTVLQAVAWPAYLLTVVVAFVLAGRRGQPQPAAQPAAASPPSRWERLAARRGGPIAAVLVFVPALIAGCVIAVLPAAAAGDTTSVTVTNSGCATEWAAGHTGTQTFAVRNKTRKAGEIVVENAAGAIVAEIETLGPATTAQMSATLGAGSYTFVCTMAGTAVRGRPVHVSGAGGAGSTTAVTPVAEADLARPNDQYQAYAATVLAGVTGDVAQLRRDLTAGDVAAAKTDWLAAQLDWEHLGASYDSFGDAGDAVDGLPGGLPGGVGDASFSGLHRIEYGLYHGQRAAQLLPQAARLATDIATVRARLGTDDEAGEATNLPLRAHEILEDAQRDHLSGLDDQGAGMAYAMTYADAQVTRTVVGELAPLIEPRAPDLLATVDAQLATLQTALLATRSGEQWQPRARATLAARQRVDAALGAALESLAAIPNLLEIPATH